MPTGDIIKNELRTNILKALANFTRICIVEKLKEGPKNVSELAKKIGESPSITSRHLNILKNAGLIEVKKNGVKVIYSLSTNAIPNILNSVDDVIKLNYQKYESFLKSKKL